MTVPNDFVTAWNALLNILGLALSRPKTSTFALSPCPRSLIWGASSSVSQFALQILSDYGYRNVIATASPRNFDLAKDCGAAYVISYTSPAADPRKNIETRLDGKVDLVLDWIGAAMEACAPSEGSRRRVRRSRSCCLSW